MKKFKKINLVAGVLILLASALFLKTHVFAVAQATCSETGGEWVKIEPVNALTYTFTPPVGFSVIENCMKVGSHDPLYGTGVTVTNTTLFNAPGGAVCTAPGVPHNGCALQNISHASFRLQTNAIPTPSVTLTPTPTIPQGCAQDCDETPTPTITPECDGDCPPEEATPTPTLTPTPSNPGGPGDGLSDGRSDGRSSTPSQGQVLGASTGPAVLGLSTTGSGTSLPLETIKFLSAIILSATGFKLFKRNA